MKKHQLYYTLTPEKMLLGLFCYIGAVLFPRAGNRLLQPDIDPSREKLHNNRARVPHRSQSRSKVFAISVWVALRCGPGSSRSFLDIFPKKLPCADWPQDTQVTRVQFHCWLQDWQKARDCRRLFTVSITLYSRWHSRAFCINDFI